MTINRARAIKAADSGGTSDGYVKVTFAGVTKRTKTVYKLVDPEWYQHFDFSVPENMQAALAQSQDTEAERTQAAGRLAALAAIAGKLVPCGSSALADESERRLLAEREKVSTDHKRVTRLFDEEAERLMVNTNRFANQELVFDLFDEDDYSADDFLGRVRFPLNQVLEAAEGRQRSYWLPFQPKNADKIKGEICLRAYFPTREELPAEEWPEHLASSLHKLNDTETEARLLRRMQSRKDLEAKLHSILKRELKLRGLSDAYAREQASVGVSTFQWAGAKPVEPERQGPMRTGGEGV